MTADDEAREAVAQFIIDGIVKGIVGSPYDYADRILATLKQLGYAKDEWLPIESAPTDKTMVALLYRKGNHSRYGVGWYMPLDGWQAWNYPKSPTHYRPLPAPPTTEES